MEILARLRPGLGPDLQRFAEAWDCDAGSLAALLPPAWPGAGRPGPREGIAVRLAVMVMPPFLARCLPASPDAPAPPAAGCPRCGAPPVWADVVDDGRRRLACALCTATWASPRLGCPFCGSDASGDVVRLEAEGTEEGYAVEACLACRGYLKLGDHRARWNLGPAIVEDWGSPHLDLAARRAGYWRALPGLLDPVPGPAAPVPAGA
jgi:formate dehydrogenase maturation protein FdhE